MQAGGRPWLWGLIGTASLLVIFFVFILLLTLLLTGGEGLTDSGTKIGVVAIDGVISSDLAEKTVRQLTKYADDTSIKGIILRIDSPGGGVASSQEIYDEVQTHPVRGQARGRLPGQRCCVGRLLHCLCGESYLCPCRYRDRQHWCNRPIGQC